MYIWKIDKLNEELIVCTGTSPMFIILCLALGTPFNLPFIFILIPFVFEKFEFTNKVNTFFKKAIKNFCFFIFSGAGCCHGLVANQLADPACAGLFRRSTGGGAGHYRI